MRIISLYLMKVEFEVGTHDELMCKNGLYYRMYTAQNKGGPIMKLKYNDWRLFTYLTKYIRPYLWLPFWLV